MARRVNSSGFMPCEQISKTSPRAPCPLADDEWIQLSHQPLAATRNRKERRDNPTARWELRVDKYRVFYEADEQSESVVVVAVGHKDHEQLRIRRQEVKL
jgi:mRNA-degrading endonuclease RelE of RelBE toxin-antitoxin system